MDLLKKAKRLFSADARNEQKVNELKVDLKNKLGLKIKDNLFKIKMEIEQKKLFEKQLQEQQVLLNSN